MARYSPSWRRTPGRVLSMRGDEEGLDLLLLGVGNGDFIGPASADVVLEVDGASEVDLLVDVGLGGETEDPDDEAGVVGGGGEGGFGMAAGLGDGEEGLVEQSATGAKIRF